MDNTTRNNNNPKKSDRTEFSDENNCEKNKK
jgi:hypothetical protein